MITSTLYRALILTGSKTVAMSNDSSPKRRRITLPAPADTLSNLETPPDPEKIKSWLAAGRQVTTREVTNALLGVIGGRLLTITAYMNRSFGDDATVISTTPAFLSDEFKTAIFPDEPSGRATLQDFYARGAVAIREWLLVELSRLTATGSPTTRRRLNAWKAYHQAAGNLHPLLLSVHDLHYYFGLLPQTVANVLNISPEAFEERRLAMRGIIDPFLEKARGKPK